MAFTSTLTTDLPPNKITIPNSDPSGHCVFCINGVSFDELWATSATVTAAALVADINASLLYPGVSASNAAGVITLANGNTPALTSVIQNVVTIPGSDPTGNCAFFVNGTFFSQLWASSATATGDALVTKINAALGGNGVVATNASGTITITNIYALTAASNVTLTGSNVTLSGALAVNRNPFNCTLTFVSGSGGDASVTVTGVQNTTDANTSGAISTELLVGAAVAGAAATTAIRFPAVLLTGQSGGVAVPLGVKTFLSNGAAILATGVTVQVDPVTQAVAQ